MRAVGSSPAVETTGWHRAGRARSTPPPAGSPDEEEELEGKNLRKTVKRFFPISDLSEEPHKKYMEAHSCQIKKYIIYLISYAKYYFKIMNLYVIIVFNY